MKKEEDGFVLFLALIVVTISMMMASVTFIDIANEAKISAQQEDVQQTLYLAEAGIEYGLLNLDDELWINAGEWDEECNVLQRLRNEPTEMLDARIPWNQITLRRSVINGGTPREEIVLRSKSIVDNVSKEVVVRVKNIGNLLKNRALVAQEMIEMSGVVNILGDIYTEDRFNVAGSFNITGGRLMENQSVSIYDYIKPQIDKKFEEFRRRADNNDNINYITEGSISTAEWRRKYFRNPKSILLIDGDLVLHENYFMSNIMNYGIIICRGNLTISGNLTFKGTIICEGDLTFSGRTYIDGTVICKGKSKSFGNAFSGGVSIKYTEFLELDNLLWGDLFRIKGWLER